MPKRRVNGYWDEETCYEEALKYTVLKEFRTQSASCYGVARAHGWLSQYVWLKRVDVKPKKVAQYSQDGDLICVFSSLAEASNNTGFNISCISECCNGKQKSSYGYLWKFIQD